MKRSVVIKRFGYKVSPQVGQPTVHRAPPFHFFRASQRDMKAPEKIVWSSAFRRLNQSARLKAELQTRFHCFKASPRDMKAPLGIDRIYKIYRIDFHPLHPVNLVNPVYSHRFRSVAH
jgi:hypothetical protein